MELHRHCSGAARVTAAAAAIVTAEAAARLRSQEEASGPAASKIPERTKVRRS